MENLKYYFSFINESQIKPGVEEVKSLFPDKDFIDESIKKYILTEEFYDLAKKSGMPDLRSEFSIHTWMSPKNKKTKTYKGTINYINTNFNHYFKGFIGILRLLNDLNSNGVLTNRDSKEIGFDQSPDDVDTSNTSDIQITLKIEVDLISNNSYCYSMIWFNQVEGPLLDVECVESVYPVNDGNNYRKTKITKERINETVIKTLDRLRNMFLSKIEEAEEKIKTLENDYIYHCINYINEQPEKRRYELLGMCSEYPNAWSKLKNKIGDQSGLDTAAGIGQIGF